MEQTRAAILTYENRLYAYLILLWQCGFSAFAIYLSLSAQPFVWFIGQTLLALNMLQWFFLIHDLGHGVFISNPKIAVVFGHIATLFCFLPYYPWRQIHYAHHRWTGWREKDPTIPDRKFEDLSPRQIQIIDFCWRYWIPIFAVSFTLETFWNLRRLNRLFPDAKNRRQNAFSIGFAVAVYALLILSLGNLFLKIWLLAFLIFLSVSDLMLLSQHTHLDYKDIQTESLKPVPFMEQALFSRTILYPKFIESFVLYHTNKHGLHHQYPKVPIYALHQFPETDENHIHWLEWLRRAKQMPGHLLIFRSTRHTGVEL
jgi:fatty acid desaturase